MLAAAPGQARDHDRSVSKDHAGRVSKRLACLETQDQVKAVGSIPWTT